MKGSPQWALDHLNPERITFAREFQALTRNDLAERIEKTPREIRQFESGQVRPDLETFVRIALALCMPTAFFAKDLHAKDRIRLDACNFRRFRP